MDDIKAQIKIELSALGMDAAVYGPIALALNDFVFKHDHFSIQY